MPEMHHSVISIIILNANPTVICHKEIFKGMNQRHKLANEWRQKLLNFPDDKCCPAHLLFLHFCTLLHFISMPMESAAQWVYKMLANNLVIQNILFSLWF